MIVKQGVVVGQLFSRFRNVSARCNNGDDCLGLDDARIAWRWIKTDS
jgi:hypothetical protein